MVPPDAPGYSLTRRSRSCVVVSLVALGALGLGACGGGDGGSLTVVTSQISTTTGQPTTTTTAPTSTTAAPTTTEAPATTKAPTTTEAKAPATTQAPEKEPEDNGEPPSIPQGEVAALVRSIDGDTITVDRVEIFTGSKALDAFKEDTGRELEGPEFYVRDTDAKTEDMPLAKQATFKVIKLSTCCDPEEVDRAAFATFLDGSNEDLFDPSPPYRLKTAYGQVVEVTQVYVS